MKTWPLWMLVAMVLSAVRLPANDFSATAREADFKTFVEDFEQNYTYLDGTDKPWLSWQHRYGTAAQSALTPEAYAGVLAEALAELHDFHSEVRSPVRDRWLPVPTFADIWAEWKDGKAVVTAVRTGSDAERAGVRVDDRVTMSNGKSLDEVVRDRLGWVGATADEAGREWALLSVLTGRADEPRIFTLARGDGSTRIINLPVERHFDRPAGLLSHRMLAGNIGLIRFNNSLGEQATVAAFDDALQQLLNTRGLVLDLRDVPSGGDSSVALGIMGRLVKTMLPYQHHRIPNYGQPDVERNWIELVAPRGPFTYAAPLAVLVDHWTGSMGEGMAIGFDAMRRGTVIGTPMAHLAGAVTDFRLPRTGIDVAFATEQLFHIDGTPRQNWMPPILVEAPETSANDPILARALGALK